MANKNGMAKKVMPFFVCFSGRAQQACACRTFIFCQLI